MSSKRESMDAQPLVSVVTTFYNAERYLGEAIESVLGQSYARWELLLVNDGSTDSSSEIARSFEAAHPEKIRYLEHPGGANLGLPRSRNAGIRLSRGRYLAFLDADDVWLPRKLGEQVALLEAHPSVGMVYGRTVYWRTWAGLGGSEGRDIVPDLGVPQGEVIPPPRLIPLYLRGGASVPTVCSILVRRTVVDQVAGFDEGFGAIYEDQVFYFKVCLVCPVLAIATIWDKYRQHDDSMMARSDREGRAIATRVRFLEWVEAYLERTGCRHAEVWTALRKEMWHKRPPLWAPESGPIPGLVRWGKKWILRLVEVALPNSWEDALWSRVSRMSGPPASD